MLCLGAMVIGGLELRSAVVVARAAGVQAPASRTPTVMAHLSEVYDAVARNLADASELMGERGYDYRPAPQVRSFGQIVAHVAGAHFLYCSQASGQPLTPGVLARLSDARPYSDVATEESARKLSKPELVSLLADSIAWCQEIYGTVTDETMRQPVGRAGRLRSWPLIDNLAHSNEHYGNLVTYLRANGLVPPSSSGRPGAN